MPYGRRTASLLLMLLREQQGDPDFGMPINTYRHALQTTTRVMQAGESEELIVCSLFHAAAGAGARSPRSVSRLASLRVHGALLRHL